MNTQRINLVVISCLIILMACSAGKMGLNNPINAAELSAEYNSDIHKGDKKYVGKYITVVGEISQYYQNKFQENILIISTKGKSQGVKCTLVKSKKDLEKPFKLGEMIKINGRCAGFNEYVLLNGCIILKD